MEQVSGFLVQGKKPIAPFMVQITPAARNYAHSEMLVAYDQSGFPKYTPKGVLGSYGSWKMRNMPLML